MTLNNVFKFSDKKSAGSDEKCRRRYTLSDAGSQPGSKWHFVSAAAIFNRFWRNLGCWWGPCLAFTWEQTVVMGSPLLSNGSQLSIFDLLNPLFFYSNQLQHEPPMNLHSCFYFRKLEVICNIRLAAYPDHFLIVFLGNLLKLPVLAFPENHHHMQSLFISVMVRDRGQILRRSLEHQMPLNSSGIPLFAILTRLTIRQV